MILIIIGNMASGKTTLCHILEDSLKDYKFLNLDDYRRKYNKKKTLEGENKAQKAMIADICKHKNVIVESTGTGKWYPHYLRLDKHDSCLIVYNRADIKICKKRYQERTFNGYKLPPIPSDWSIEFNSSLEWMHNKLRFGRWNMVIDAKKKPELNAELIIGRLYG